MSLIQKTYKSTDTEEWFDIIFNRPLGYLWARLFNHYGVHPNTVTVLSIILGVTGGLLFMNDADTTSGFLLNLLGVILFVWADIFDSTDGQLARMTGKKTQFGRILDGASGDFWFFCVYLSIALRLQDKPIDFSLFTVHFSLPHWGLLAWVLVFFSGVFCHAAQCRQSDYYRTIHLHFLIGTPLDRADDQARINEQLSWRKAPLQKFFQWSYARYTAAQERSTPHFQALWQQIQTQYGGTPPPSFLQEFRRRSLPLMKYANFITFNIRAFALYFAVLADIPWFYPFFEMTVLTAVYLYLHAQHEQMSAELKLKIKK